MVTTTDRVKIVKLLIENNKRHFDQAEGTSPIIAPLADILGGRMSKSCDKILNSTYDIPMTLPHLVKKYLRNMKRNNNIPLE